MQTVPFAPEIHTDAAIALLDALTEIVIGACAVINSLSAKNIEHRIKPDRSPVTAADEAAEAAIVAGLKQLLPEIPIIAEEMAARTQSPELNGSFILVDPLDGTKEFIAGSDQFTVNVAIITRSVPLAGIVAAPKQGYVWRGVVGHRAEQLRLVAGKAVAPQPIHTRAWPAEGAVAMMSRSHLDPTTHAFLARLEPIARMPSGSSIKFCKIAEGIVDVYPRFAAVCEWDVAAGHALLTAAGGIVTTPDGAPLTYGRRNDNFRVPAFIAWGDPAKAAAFAREGVDRA